MDTLAPVAGAGDCNCWKLDDPCGNWFAAVWGCNPLFRLATDLWQGHSNLPGGIPACSSHPLYPINWVWNSEHIILEPPSTACVR